MTLNRDTQHLPRSVHEWDQFIRALAQHPDDTVETSWLELKGPLDLTTAEHKFKVAKAILGFANRDPIDAEGHLDGRALLVIGVAGGRATGTRRIEDHQLINALTSYLGQADQAPRWTTQRCRVDDVNDILIVIVDAPQFGDPAYPLRKAFDKASRGTIYVRPSTESVPADDVAVDMLIRRATNRASGFSLTLGLNGDAITRASWNVRKLDPIIGETINRYLAAAEKPAEDEALAAAATVRDAMPRLTFGDMITGACRRETRSPKQFRDELEDWRLRCREGLALMFQDIAATRCAASVLTVTNTCGRFLEDLEIEVHIEGTIWSCDRPDGEESVAARVPKPPRKWGPFREPLINLSSYSSFPLASPSLFARVPHPRGNSASFRNAGSVDVTLRCPELRPGATVTIRREDIALICTDPDLAQTHVTYTATARGVHEQHKGEFSQPIVVIGDLTPRLAEILNTVLSKP